jgi:hypothetical protein
LLAPQQGLASSTWNTFVIEEIKSD